MIIDLGKFKLTEDYDCDYGYDCDYDYKYNLVSG